MVNDNPYSSPITESAPTEFLPGHIGSVFGNAWQIFTQNIWQIFIIVAIAWVPLAFINGLVADHFFDSGDELKDLRNSFRFTDFLDNFFGIFATSAIIWLGVMTSLKQRNSVGEALSVGVTSWAKIWTTRFLSNLAIIRRAGFVGHTRFYLAIRMSMSQTVAVVERVYGPTAIKRSFELTRGKFWQFAILWTFYAVSIFGAYLLLSLPYIFLVEWEHWIVESIIESLASIVSAYGLLCFYCAYAELIVVESSE